MKNLFRYSLYAVALLVTITSSAQTNRFKSRSTAYKTHFQRIVAGGNHTLEIRSGNIWAWGLNNHGQLGDGTTNDAIKPKQITTSGDWVNIATGYYHSLGIKANGTLWAWGYNASSQLGDSSTTDRTAPVQIGTDTGWVAVACGGDFSFGLKADGTLWAWGDNDFGQLGDFTNLTRMEPIQISGSNWISISCGANHSLALKADGTIWAWGYNIDGQLGDGTTTGKFYPVQVGMDRNWTSISAGSDHSLALKANGTLWAWGSNASGQLGDSTTNGSSSPIEVRRGNNDWTSISAGGSFSAGLKGDGSLYAWGDNLSGQLGDNSIVNKLVPQKIGQDSTWISVCAGNAYVMALKANGDVFGWGNNSFGMIGDSSTTDRRVPVRVSSVLSGWVSVSVGSSHTVALRSDGTLWGWGRNDFGQLGIGLSGNVTSAVQIGYDNDWVSVTVGEYHTAALKADGTIWTWGANDVYQLGNGTSTNSPTPVKINKTKGWVSISAGFNHNLAIRADGTLWGWGFNATGQVGEGSTTNRDQPFRVGNDSDWVAVSAGGHHTLGLKADGTLWAWGLDVFGQLGDSTNTNSSVPIRVYGDSNWIEMSAGLYHNLAIRSNGTLWAWGSGVDGKLGNGSSSGSNYPIQVGSDNNWTRTQAGNGHSLGIRANGYLWGWGMSSSGELGDVFSVSNVPNRVSTTSKVVTLGAGLSYSGVITSSRSQVCMTGVNSFGQLGTGNTNDVTTFTCSGNTIRTGNINPLAFCKGAVIKVPFDITGAYSPGNIFNMQLSDSSGNFIGVTNIGSLLSNTAGIITGTLPDTLPPGNKYRIRVVSGMIIGSRSPQTITVYAPKAVFMVNSDTQCFNGHRFEFQDNSFGALIFRWSFGDTSKISMQQNPVKTYGVPQDYTVKLVIEDINGCRDSATAPVTVFPSPVADFTINDSVQCLEGNNFIFYDQSFIGTGSLSRTWTYGIDTATTSANPGNKQYDNAGIYRVTLRSISDHGCESMMQHSVYLVPMPKADITAAGDTIFCEGGSVVLEADTGLGYTYQWKKDGELIPLATDSVYTAQDSGNYYVMVDHLGCSDSSGSIHITENPRPVTGAISGDISVNENSTHTYKVTPTAGSVYAWFFANGTGSSTTDSIDITWVTAGTVELKVVETAANGCEGDTIRLTVQIGSSTGIKGINKGTMNLYPNPARNQVTFSHTFGGPVTLELMEMSGKVLRTYTVDTAQELIDVGGLGAGVYLVQVRYEGQVAGTQRLVIVH